MGLVVNRRVGSLTFTELLKQLNIGPNRRSEEIRVHFGGPVESGRGFVLHSADYVQNNTMLVSDNVALTATIDILRDSLPAAVPAQHPRTGHAGGARASSMPRSRQRLAVGAAGEPSFDADLGRSGSAPSALGIDFVNCRRAGHA
jgi:putative transcriptional regulator